MKVICPHSCGSHVRKIKRAALVYTETHWSHISDFGFPFHPGIVCCCRVGVSKAESVFGGFIPQFYFQWAIFFFYTAESGEAFPFEQRWWDISFLDCMSCYNFTIVPFLMAGKTWKHFFLPSSFSGFLCWEINRVHMLLSESSHAHALREAGLFSRHVNYILVELRV